MEVRPLDDDDRAWVAETISREWGLPVVSTSGPHDPSEFPGFVAVREDQRLGVVTYRTTEDECELVTLNSLQPGQGVGTALLAAVKLIADQRGLRVWLITTDENVNAIRFYESRGMSRRAIHRNFVDTVRRYKPDSSAIGRDNEYRDAIEYSY